MLSFLRSRKFTVYIWISILATLFFVYFMGFTLTGLDREAYNRGEEVQTIGLSYYWKTTFGGNAISFPEALTFKTRDGRDLSPDEMVELINPELDPFVEDGKIFYIPIKERTEWGEKIYWAPANPLTTNIAKFLKAIRW